MSSIKRKKIMEINTINLVGRAGREPDVRYFESGSIVANFTLAVNWTDEAEMKSQTGLI